MVIACTDRPPRAPTDLLLRHVAAEDTVEFERLDARLVADVDEGVVVAVVRHDVGRHRAPAILRDARTHPTEHPDVAWRGAAKNVQKKNGQHYTASAVLWECNHK